MSGGRCGSEADGGMLGFRGRRQTTERLRVRGMVAEATLEAHALVDLAFLAIGKPETQNNELRAIAYRQSNGVLGLVSRLGREELNADVRCAVLGLRDTLEVLSDELERGVAPTTPRASSFGGTSAIGPRLSTKLEEVLFAARFLALVAGQG